MVYALYKYIDLKRLITDLLFLIPHGLRLTNMLPATKNRQ